MSVERRKGKRELRALKRVLAGKKDVFAPNGCSRVPDSLFGVPLKDICDEHDFEYWLGGTELERLQADTAFAEKTKKRFEEHGKAFLGKCVSTWRRLAVRAFGGPHWDYW